GAQIAPVADKLNQGTQVQGQNAVFATGKQHQIVLLLLAPRQSRARVAYQSVAAGQQLAQQSGVQFLHLDKLRVTRFGHEAAEPGAQCFPVLNQPQNQLLQALDGLFVDLRGVGGQGQVRVTIPLLVTQILGQEVGEV